MFEKATKLPMYSRVDRGVDDEAGEGNGCRDQTINDMSHQQAPRASSVSRCDRVPHPACSVQIDLPVKHTNRFPAFQRAQKYFFNPSWQQGESVLI